MPLALLQRLVDVRRGELAASLWSAAFFASVLGGYALLRPLREAMGLSGGVDELSRLFLGTLGVTLLANPAWAWMVGRWPRRVFLPAAYRFFMLNLAAFALLMGLAPEALGASAGKVFYVWYSVFNLFAVSLFWSLMADVFRLEQGKRLFGFIGVGGTLGTIAGAWLSGALVVRIGPVGLILVAIVVLELAVRSARRVVASGTAGVGGTGPALAAVAGDAPGAEAGREPGAPIGGGALSGVREVLGSPYLLGICAYIAAIAVVATFLYFAQARIVSAAAVGVEARTVIFARIDFWSQVATLALQLFVTGRVIRILGVGLVLAILPLVSAAGFAALWLRPELGVLIAFQVAHRSLRYGLVRPARETLFTVVSRAAKYKSKAFVDTFVFRGADALAALADRWIALAGLGLAGVAAVVAPIAVLWAAVGLFLGRKVAR